MKHLFATALCALALMSLPLAGCATGTSPDRLTAKDYSQPRETIRAAESMGADQMPKAQLYLSYATDALQRADQAIDRQDQRRARLALGRAQSDADLALTLAKQNHMVKRVRKIQHRIDRLNSEVE